MAGPDAIRDVGDTLLALLRGGIDPAIVDPARIVLATPQEFDGFANPDRPMVTIFLYRVAINAEMRNRPRRTLPDGRVTRPLLPLELYFLVTPWARRASDEHRIAGRILQVLYDSGELGSAALQGDSWEPGDSVQLLLESLSIEDHYRIWDSSEMPYRLSLTYLARVVGIRPGEAQTVVPVVEAELQRLRLG